jgi:hypothetical protein
MPNRCRRWPGPSDTRQTSAVEEAPPQVTVAAGTDGRPGRPPRALETVSSMRRAPSLAGKRGPHASRKSRWLDRPDRRNLDRPRTTQTGSPAGSDDFLAKTGAANGSRTEGVPRRSATAIDRWRTRVSKRRSTARTLTACCGHSDAAFAKKGGRHPTAVLDLTVFERFKKRQRESAHVDP